MGHGASRESEAEGRYPEVFTAAGVTLSGLLTSPVSLGSGVAVRPQGLWAHLSVLPESTSSLSPCSRTLHSAHASADGVSCDGSQSSSLRQGARC